MRESSSKYLISIQCFEQRSADERVVPQIHAEWEFLEIDQPVFFVHDWDFIEQDHEDFYFVSCEGYFEKVVMLKNSSSSTSLRNIPDSFWPITSLLSMD